MKKIGDYWLIANIVMATIAILMIGSFAVVGGFALFEETSATESTAAKETYCTKRCNAAGGQLISEYSQDCYCQMSGYVLWMNGAPGNMPVVLPNPTPTTGEKK